MSEGNGAPGLDREELRAAVRAVLRDVLPTLPAPTAAGLTARTEPVRVRDDSDLAALVARVLSLAEDPEACADLRSGRHRFVLAGSEPPGAPAAPSEPTHRVDRGAVTERRVAAAAAAGARLVVGPRAVLTPLARDKARALGVAVEKEH